MQTQSHTSGTFDVSLGPYTTMTDSEISAQLDALILDPSLHFPPDPLSSTNQSFTVHSLTPGTALNNDFRLLENLGIGRAAARRHAEDTALATATYVQQDEDRWIHKLASISRELGYTISTNLPQELLFSSTDTLQSCSLCQRAIPSLYRIHTSDGPAAQNIIRDISVRITAEMFLSFGRCCVGEHTPECSRKSRFLDDFMEPAYRLHLVRRGIPLCFACYAGAPQASADPNHEPLTTYSQTAQRDAGQNSSKPQTGHYAAPKQRLHPQPPRSPPL
jgi:hypothetical protein